MNLNYPVISNRNVTESRPFDFIYDPEYCIPTSKNFYRLAEDALEETAEQNIRPVYQSMFSDVRRFPKHQFIFKTESLPISWEEKHKKEETMKLFEKNDEVCGRDLYKFVSKSNIDSPVKMRYENYMNSSAHKISINSIGESKATKVKLKDFPVIKQKNKSTKSTQTDYRDSETQTDPWISPYDEKLNSLLFLKPGKFIRYSYKWSPTTIVLSAPIPLEIEKFVEKTFKFLCKVIFYAK
ncbi:cilia- and flagella-associated protein 91-like [Planococcus citri]|uniref:cilia- and flagella-associated protein 91-like n=1 Tax=Planococcus citri TaxID=170843 RepID=UPI0031F89A65